MALFLFLLGIPIVVYLAFVLAPQGSAFNGILLCTVVMLGYVWMGYLLAWSPLWTGAARADTYTLAAAVVFTVASGVGAATGLWGRKLAARVEVLNYPLVAVLIFLVVFLPLMFILGV